ncbi:MAG TPA: hypothetical protein VG323_21055, partial [Thermoanaerobaculia bacterium]|nr:hypothetical protein [Thermoanaerobaculia bacterium]
ASAMIMADGDPHVLAMPAPANDGRWLIVRRVNTGSYVPPADAPFLLESFDGVDGASARFTSIPSDRGPMILSVPDGKFRGGHGARIAGEAPRREPAVIWIIIRRPMASHTYS